MRLWYASALLIRHVSTHMYMSVSIYTCHTVVHVYPLKSFFNWTDKLKISIVKLKSFHHKHYYQLTANSSGGLWLEVMAGGTNTHRHWAFFHPLDNSVQHLLSSNKWLPDCTVTSFVSKSSPVQILAPKWSPTTRFTSCSHTLCWQLLGGWELLLSGKRAGGSARKCCDKKSQPAASAVFCFDTLQLSITHNNERLNTLDNDKLREFFFFCPLSVSALWFPGCSFPGYAGLAHRQWCRNMPAHQQHPWPQALSRAQVGAARRRLHHCRLSGGNRIAFTHHCIGAVLPGTSWLFALGTIYPQIR